MTEQFSLLLLGFALGAGVASLMWARLTSRSLRAHQELIDAVNVWLRERHDA